ncbi:MAG: hypothetical protein AAFW97_09745 [Pseudomonadota bacterium]
MDEAIAALRPAGLEDSILMGDDEWMIAAMYFSNHRYGMQIHSKDRSGPLIATDTRMPDRPRISRKWWAFWRPFPHDFFDLAEVRETLESIFERQQSPAFIKWVEPE